MFMLDDLRFGKPGAEENFVEYLKTTCSIDNVFECIEVCIAQLTRKIVNSLQNNQPYMHEVGILYALIDELSPVEGSFYWLLQSLTDMYAVPISILPSHFQFLINDPQLCAQNPHMQGLQMIFKENLMQNRKIERSDFRSHLEFKAQPQLILFIHILNFAQYYKIPTLEFSNLTNDVLNTVKGKLKRKFPNDLMLNYFISNPYVVIIRRMLFHLTNEVIKYRGIDATKKPEKLTLLQQYVILIQESVLYSPVMQRYPEELKFTSQQSRLLHTHQSKSKKETDICLIYILIILNNQYGIKLETLLTTSNFQPERKSYKPQNVNIERTFFFDAGRQQFILDFHQVLYKYLNDALINYQFEIKSSDYSVLPILSTYLLFLRWQYARYELQLIHISQLADNCLHQYAQKYYKIQKDKQVLVNQKPAFSLNGMINVAVTQVKRTLQRVLKNQDKDKLRILRSYKHKDEDVYEFDFRNQLDLKTQIDLIQDPLQYFEKEIESQKVSKAQSARLIYPFYTYTANKIVDVLLQQQGQKEDVQQAILNFTYFFYSQSYDYLFNGIIPRSIKADDIKRSSDKFYKISDYDRFLLGEHYNYDKLIRVIEQSKLNKLTKDKATSFYRAINSKSSNLSSKNEDNYSVSNQTSRLYVKPKQYQPWQVPQRTNEFLILLLIARILSFAIDKITLKQSTFQVPQTSWPRLFSGYTGLLIFILSIMYLIVKKPN